MDWARITERKERNLEYEKKYHFQFGLDYDEELKKLKEILASDDEDARLAFLERHSGLMAFYGNRAYFQELKKAGIL